MLSYANGNNGAGGKKGKQGEGIDPNVIDEQMIL